MHVIYYKAKSDKKYKKLGIAFHDPNMAINEAANIFRDAGFREARVHHPENFRESLPIETSRKPSFIDVIEAVV